MKLIGYHINGPKSWNKNISKIHSIAFFLGSPRIWSTKPWTESDIKTFHDNMKSVNIDLNHIVVHGTYLLNAASDKVEVRNKTNIKFIEELQECERIGIRNYVFHPGTSKQQKQGLELLVQLVQHGLQNTSNVRIIIENMTKTNTLCQTWSELKYVLDKIQDKRVGICLDTAHCWGAGKKRGMCFESLLDDFDRNIGLDRLYVIHLNDSKIGLGDNRDRHEDILKGKITKSFWYPFLTDSRIENVPTILETPTNCVQTVRDIIDKKIIPSEKQIVSNIELARIQTISFIKEVQKQDIQQIETKFLTRSWQDVLKPEFKKPYFIALKNTLYNETRTICPKPEHIFNALNQTPLSNIKVVILGQDPYHTSGVAHGLSFSVTFPPIPPSLRNIFKELKRTFPEHQSINGDLTGWTHQGVLLLNMILTVCEHKPLSHEKIGWETFTKHVIQLISHTCPFVVFLLWGNKAKKIKKYIHEKHVILESSHPSPLSVRRGKTPFHGCNHFQLCNDALVERKLTPIQW